MNIKERLAYDMKLAMKNGDKASLSTIRLILAKIQRSIQDFKDDAIKKGTTYTEVTEDQLIDVVQKFKKDTQEELEGFQKAGNTERCALLIDSLHLVQAYLPAPMSEEEVTDVIQATIVVLKEKGTPLNKGSIMKVVSPLLKGKVDNKLIMQVIEAALV